MWCVSPRSYLHSVWRAVDDGFVDPFFYFYSTIRIGHCIRIPQVPFKEFMTDPRLGSNPFVKSHFQGAGGKPFPLEDYLRILEILDGKGFDTSSLPVPPRHAFVFGDRIQSERDVEAQLVEPLLSRLGYAAEDWLRQMPIRMGRGERNYPDYAVLPVTTRGEESASFLIEAKLSIATQKQLEDAYLQGKSYGLRLQADFFALAAQEGFWLFRESDNFASDRSLRWTWEDLEHPDRLHELAALIGKGNDRRSKTGRRKPQTMSKNALSMDGSV